MKNKLKKWMLPGAILLWAVIVACIVACTVSACSAQTEESVPPEDPVVADAMPDLGNLIETPAEYLAKTVWGEARGCSRTEQAAVVWCVLNRVDSDLPYMPDDVISVITQPGQFTGYSPDNPVTDEIYALVIDVLCRWAMEPSCVGGVGRVLPEEYMWFSGDGQQNTFRDGYQGGNVWTWELDSPYCSGG